MIFDFYHQLSNYEVFLVETSNNIWYIQGCLLHYWQILCYFCFVSYVLSSADERLIIFSHAVRIIVVCCAAIKQASNIAASKGETVFLNMAYILLPLGEIHRYSHHPPQATKFYLMYLQHTTNILTFVRQRARAKAISYGLRVFCAHLIILCILWQYVPNSFDNTLKVKEKEDVVLAS